MKHTLLVCCVVLCMGIAPSCYAAKTILLLHSGSPGTPWADRVAEGVRAELSEAGANAELVRLWAGADQDNSEDHFEVVSDELDAVVNTHALAGVICDGDTAFALLRKHGRGLFKGIPAAFCGVFEFREFMAGQYPGVCAVYQAEETFENMLKLHPRARTVAVIVDGSEAGEQIRKQVETAFARHMDRVQLIFPGHEEGRDQGLLRSDVLKVAAHMPGDGLLLFGTFTRDRNGAPVDEAALAKEVISCSKVPVHVLSDIHFGYGAAGGLLVDSIGHGKAAVRLLMKQWKSIPTQVPTKSTLANQWHYDKAGLQRALTDMSVLDAPSPRKQPVPESGNRLWIYMAGGLAAVIFLIAFLRRRG